MPNVGQTIAKSMRDQARIATPQLPRIATVVSVDYVGAKLAIQLNAASAPQDVILSSKVREDLLAKKIHVGDKIALSWQGSVPYGDATYATSNTYLPLIASSGITLAAPTWNSLALVGTDLVGSFNHGSLNAVRSRLWKRLATDSPAAATMVDDSVATNFRLPFNLGVGSNLITNGGFESGDFTGWYLAVNPTFWSIATTPNRSGAFSAKCAIVNDAQTCIIWSNVIPVVPNTNYTASGGIDIPTLTASYGAAAFQIRWFVSPPTRGESSSSISDSTISSLTTVTSGYVFTSGTVVSPSTANYAVIRVIVQNLDYSLSKSVIAYFDDLALNGESPTNTTPLFALRDIDANNNSSPFSTWLAPQVQQSQLGAPGSGIVQNPTIAAHVSDLLGYGLTGVAFTPNGFTDTGWDVPLISAANQVAETWVYVSSTSFKIVGLDATKRYLTGTKVRWKQGSGYLYGTVSTSSFSTDTTVTLASGDPVLNATITDNYYSYGFVSPGMSNPIPITFTVPVTIANGGTGQNNATGAFNALSPLTTLGDLLYHDGANNVRLAANGAATKKYLQSVSSGNPSWAQVDWTDLSGKPSSFTPAAHQLDGATHTVSGLTTGHFLKATGATTFGFAAHGLSYSDVGADAAGAAATVQGNLNTHTGLTTTAHGGIVASTDSRLTDARTPTVHNVLNSTYHGDALTDSITAGDVLIGNATPKIARLAITVPAAGTLNYFGVNNGETLPSWKSASSSPGTAAAILQSSPTTGLLTLAQLTVTNAPTFSAMTPGSVLFTGTAGVLSQDNSNLFWDNTNKRLGVVVSPSYTLDVAGTFHQTLDAYLGGTTVRVKQATTNIGINRNPDTQFDLDVNGSMRAGGYIVGKHALQLSGALLIAHYDGMAPYNTDFTGDPTGHMGQVATVSGGVIYRPGKFGKAVQIAEATTNLCTNPRPDPAGSTTGYSYFVPSGSAAITSVAVSNPNGVGTQAIQFAFTGVGSGGALWWTPFAVTSGQSYATQVWVYSLQGFTGNVVLQRNGAPFDNISNYVPITIPAATWTKVTGILVATATDNARWEIYGLPAGTFTIQIQNLGIENKAYVTPYGDGSLNPGHSWSGTPHASTSSRTAASVSYPAIPNAQLTQGTLAIWGYYAPGQNCKDSILTLARIYNSSVREEVYIAVVPSTNKPQIGNYSNGVAITESSYTASALAAGWHHFVLTWSSATSTLNFYVDGVISIAGAGYIAPLAWDTITPGLFATYGYAPFNGEVDDLVILDHAATATEVLSIYSSNAPVFAETSDWAWRTPSTTVWADSQGLWALDAVAGNPVFGLSTVAGMSWGGATLDAGDLMLGRQAATVGNLLWDASAGALYLRSNATNIVTLDTNGAAITGLLKMSGASAAISIGATPPTSATVGTGIWLDRTGMYGLASNVLQAKFDAATGAITAGAGNVTLDANGITFAASGSSFLKFKSGATQYGSLWSGNDGSFNFTALSQSAVAGAPGQILVNSNSVSGMHADIELWATRGTPLDGDYLQRYLSVGTAVNGVRLNGNITWATDNTNDLGAAGANRPKNLFLAGTIRTALGSDWDFGTYTTTAPAATGYVTIKIGGVSYKLLAST